MRTGEVEAYTSTEVLQEILDPYFGLRRADLAHEVYELFVQLCPVVLPVTLADTDRARTLLRAVDGLSVRDAVHAGVALNHDIPRIASFDRGFERVAGLERLPLETDG